MPGAGLYVKQGGVVRPAATVPGPRGLPGTDGVDGLSGVVTWNGSSYSARPFPEAGVLFVGPVNPDSLGLMQVGDSWHNTDPGGLGVAAVEPRVLYGTGRPEGTTTAPVGTRYIDTAATNGAIEWIKASGAGNTGWRVVYGDTGWRDISSLLSSGITPSTSLGMARLRRTGSQVLAIFKLDIANAVSTSSLLTQMPEGFRSSVWTYPPGLSLGSGTGLGGSQLLPASSRIGLLSAGPGGGAQVGYCTGVNTPFVGPLTLGWAPNTATDDPWPTSLPGVAA